MKKIERKKFIQLSLMSGAALYLAGCGVNSDKKVLKTDLKREALKTDSILPNTIQQTIAPTFILYKKGDAEYEILRRGYNKRIQQFPAAIAQCNTTEEVSQAVKYAIENKWPVSIKSGGHSFEGFSCNNDGLVINLSGMNKVSWDDEETISVGPGCKLSELYDATLPKNKILPAGSCGGVGIGGLTLGGGYGFFSRKYGLTCDSLIELTMVDGKGNIVKSVDQKELLWACKGGGNGNFGVITNMKFKVKDAPSFFQSYRFKIKNVAIERAKEVMEKWFSITAKLPPSCFSAFVLNGKSVYILLTNYDDGVNDLSTFIDDLSAIVDTTSSGIKTPLAKALKVFYGRPNPLNFKNASAGFYKNFEDIRNCIPAVLEKVTQTPGMIYQINTLGGMINDNGLASQSSYAHRDQNYLSELQTYWEGDSRMDTLLKTFEEVQQLLYDNGIKSQYRNYPDILFKDYKNAYYGENYSRLQKVKLQFDPGNIFDYAQGIKI
ncbi:MAG: FAD-binding oxidoreductase [Ginsengibacter sp.]